MRRDRRGSTALEFAIVATPLMLLLFGAFEYGRLLWTLQALQLAGDQTARCVAVGWTACATPATYAANTAKAFGAFAMTSGGVTVDTQTSASTPVVCKVPSGNSAAHVKLSLTFSSPVSKLLPLAGTITTNSCYPTTGK